MLKFIIPSALMILFAADVSGIEKHSVKPKDGLVPDEKTAVRIAEAVLAPIYSEKTVEKERPYKAVLNGRVWTVEGTLPAEYQVGGVGIVELSKDDGRIIRVSHGR